MPTIAFYDPAKDLRIWTIYEGAKDIKSRYCARLFLATKAGSVATGELIEADSIEELRDQFERQGLIPMKRDDRDDPVIVEVWL